MTGKADATTWALMVVGATLDRDPRAVAAIKAQMREAKVDGDALFTAITSLAAASIAELAEATGRDAGSLLVTISINHASHGPRGHSAS